MIKKHFRHFLGATVILCGSLFFATATIAQTVQSEDFTGTTTSNSWHFFNGACLTAGTSATATTSPGQVPSCESIRTSYYNQNLVGGANGLATNAHTLPDPNGSGALRLTNGHPFGYSQSGAIVSNFAFPTSQGIQITFKTVTYRGDSGGAGHNGADGISFFLMDALKPAGIGAWGGSLGYSCSNTNPPYNGLDGAYIGLGIDEYGNFLNGATLMPGYAGTNTVSGTWGDNTATGYGYHPGRIGMRGAGNVSWSALTAAYSSNPSDSTRPYYPASLATACPTGYTYNSVSNACESATCSATDPDYDADQSACASCPAGTTYNFSANTCGSCPAAHTYNAATNTCATCPVGAYNAATNQCDNICTVGTYSSTTNQCINICAVGTYNAATNQCINTNICPSTGNWTYSTSRNECRQCGSGRTYIQSGPNVDRCFNDSASQKYRSPLGSQATINAAPTTAAATSVAPATVAVTTTAATYDTRSRTPANRTEIAVRNTCRTGRLWNFADPFNPTDAGPATLANPFNTAKILDYAAIPGAYSELASLPAPFTIATESAISRGDATPIFYNLKITQDGLLSLSYSMSGGAYQSVIKDQDITAANGDVPANVRFGLGASTGGSTNIHEIMCFKAAPSIQSGSSTSVNEKLAAKVQAGTQAYFAFYNQNSWTGALTAQDLINTAGVVTVSSTANWDAACGLTGTTAGIGCPRTGVTTAQTAIAPTSRVLLTCTGTCDGSSGNTGIPLNYTSLSTTQKSWLDAGDSAGATRVSYLRGDRSNEINTVGVGTFRKRDSLLSDIVESSPIWVGPPSNPYTGSWLSRLPANPSSTPHTYPENSAAPGTQTYLQFIAAKQTRLNVVYSGANDGFLHGFRSGSFSATGTFINDSTTPNDGKEVLAYMPSAVLKTIHSSTTPAIDFSSAKYGHNFYVDAAPATDDLFYAGAWHTWLVGGLGAGGAGIYALDVTDPSNFSESNAAALVIGEWNAATISCATPGGTTCGDNLGNTYGTPQIRRLHNGMWAVIFGNGFASATGDAGIYIMTVDPTSAAKTFYYLSTGVTGGNGIAYASPADLDGDHITDYVYAGDLLGNVWRFDLTSTEPSNWAASTAPLFTTAAGQPITSKLQLVATTANSVGGLPRVLVEFGTGRKTPISNSAPETYATGTQSLYAVWDWNLSGWNATSSIDFASLDATTAATGLTSPFTLAKSMLQQQVFSASASSAGNIAGTNNTVCWKGATLCALATDNNKFGWYVDLQTSSGKNEQIIFNPLFFQGAFIVNSTLPANNIATSCSIAQDTGFTYVISATTGGVFNGVFPGLADSQLAGAATSATGTPYVVTTAEGTVNLVYQTVSGTPSAKVIAPPTNSKAKRLTWVELR